MLTGRSGRPRSGPGAPESPHLQQLRLTFDARLETPVRRAVLVPREPEPVTVPARLGVRCRACGSARIEARQVLAPNPDRRRRPWLGSTFVLALVCQDCGSSGDATAPADAAAVTAR